MEQLPTQLDRVTKGELYFIALDADVYEGEMRVGLARAEENCDDSSGEVRVRWYARKLWLSKQRHSWGTKTAPYFEFARPPNNARRLAYITPESMSDVLPLLPELTQRGDDMRKPRLTSENVRALRELCRRRGLLVEEREACGPQKRSGKRPRKEMEGEEEEEEGEEESMASTRSRSRGW